MAPLEPSFPVLSPAEQALFPDLLLTNCAEPLAYCSKNPVNWCDADNDCGVSSDSFEDTIIQRDHQNSNYCNNQKNQQDAPSNLLSNASYQFPDILHLIFPHKRLNPTNNIHRRRRIMKIRCSHSHHGRTCHNKFQRILRRTDSAHA